MYESSSSQIDSGFENGVLRIKLNRPDVSNALTYEMLMAALELVKSAAEDLEVRAVVLEGAGDDFCAGSDIDMGPWPETYANRRPGGEHGPGPIIEQDLCKIIRNMNKPTIALLKGRSMDAGLDLACATDIRLVSVSSILADTRILKAQHNAAGLSYILPRLIGQSQAMRILLTGEEISGPEAARIALAYECFDDSEFDGQAEKIVSELAVLPTRSYSLIKKQILDQLDLDYNNALMHSLAVRQTNLIEDTQEGMTAFREKRKPQYKGR